jgi:hypothetical protein
MFGMPVRGPTEPQARAEADLAIDEAIDDWRAARAGVLIFDLGLGGGNVANSDGSIAAGDAGDDLEGHDHPSGAMKEFSSVVANIRSNRVSLGVS